MISLAWFLTTYPLRYYDTQTTYEHFFDTRFFSVVNMLYIIGIIMSAIAFLGCVGAYKESICTLMLFSLCLVTVFVLEVTFVTAGYIMREQVKEGLSNAMNTLLHDYGQNPASRRTINRIQETLGCCGVNSCEDWQGHVPEYNPFVSRGMPYPEFYLVGGHSCGINLANDSLIVQLPESCCEEIKAFTWETCQRISKRGCIHQLKFLIQRYFILIAGLAAGIAALQLTGIVFACLLAKALYVQRIKLEIQHSELKEKLISNNSQEDWYLYTDPPLHTQVKCEPFIQK